MTETAYVIIRRDRSTPAEIARQVRRIPGVAAVDVTLGEVDVVAVVRDETTRGLAEIGRQVQAIEGVSSVWVCVVVRP